PAHLMRRLQRSSTTLMTRTTCVVPLDEPSWWYGDDGSVLPHLLSPLGAVYGAAASYRMRSAGYAAGLPVICVGNFVAGGSGKTPFTRALCARLQAKGRTPAVLMRGYGGRLTGPCWVDAAHHTTADVGDEALMLARDLPVTVARDRAAGARSIERTGRPEACAGRSTETTIDVIVMDDGLLNPALDKTLTFALVDRGRGLGNTRVIPAGPLRAPLRDQLARVDCIVLTGSTPTPTDADAAVPSGQRWNWLGATSMPVITTTTRPSLDRTADRGAALVFAGIANPGRVTATAAEIGYRVVATRTFRDHHAFTDDDVHALREAAAPHQARLVTTEKDHVRLATGSAACKALAAEVDVLRIETVFEAAAAAAIDRLLDRALSGMPDEQTD
ncbi:MAG: tetraacyldisaccharide 4'-kinase, partial [Pseudomonadota bacterium]